MYTIIASFNVQLFFIHMLQLHIYTAWFPLFFSQFPFAPLAVSLLLPFVTLSTYLAPSSCDRSRPPQSQVARKLSPLSPIALVYPSLPNFHPLWVFPGPNVLLIRTHPNPFPSERNSRALIDES